MADRKRAQQSLFDHGSSHILAPWRVWLVYRGNVDSPLPAERHHRIEEFLHNHNVVRVSTLSELLHVSEVTVRRDLEVAGFARMALAAKVMAT
jgi:hypothetical protein